MRTVFVLAFAGVVAVALAGPPPRFNVTIIPDPVGAMKHVGSGLASIQNDGRIFVNYNLVNEKGQVSPRLYEFSRNLVPKMVPPVHAFPISVGRGFSDKGNFCYGSDYPGSLVVVDGQQIQPVIDRNKWNRIKFWDVNDSGIAVGQIEKFVDGFTAKAGAIFNSKTGHVDDSHIDPDGWQKQFVQINNAGQIVSKIAAADNVSPGHLYLKTPGQQDQYMGWGNNPQLSETGSVAFDGFLFKNGKKYSYEKKQTFPEKAITFSDIARDSLAVGNKESGVPGVVAWGGAIYDLAPLLDIAPELGSISGIRPECINDHGQILCTAVRRAGNSTFDYLYLRLDPVPEPATMVAMAVGLAGILRRRKAPLPKNP